MERTLKAVGKMVQIAINFFKTFSLVTAILALATGGALAESYFGAIAYSRSTGASGYAYDHSSRRNAEAAAMRNCRSQAGG